MSHLKKEKWRTKQRKFHLTNAKLLLKKIEKNLNHDAIIASEYANLIFVLETTLQNKADFDLSYKLIQVLFTHVFAVADWERWLIYIQKALDQSQDVGTIAEQARLWEQYSAFLWTQSDLDLCIQAFQKAIELFDSIRAYPKSAQIKTQLATVYIRQGKIDLAYQLCQEALDVAQTLGSEQICGDAYLAITQIHTRSFTWDKALIWAKKAYSCYQNIGDEVKMAGALSNIMGCQANLQQWEAADIEAQKLVTYFTKRGDLVKLVRVKNAMGIFSYEQGRYLQAEHLWQEALTLNSSTRDPHLNASLKNNLGKVYTKLEKWDTATQMLMETIHFHEKQQNVSGWINSLDNLADLYEAQQAWPKCIAVLEKAIAILEKEHEERLSSNSLSLLKNMGIRLENLYSFYKT